MKPLADIVDDLEGRLPKDTPDWLRRAIADVLYWANMNGKFRLAEEKDLRPRAKIMLVQLRRENIDYRNAVSFHAVLDDQPTRTMAESRYVLWSDERGGCFSPLEDFLSLGENWPMVCTELPYEIALAGSNDDDSGND